MSEPGFLGEKQAATHSFCNIIPELDHVQRWVLLSGVCLCQPETLSSEKKTDLRYLR